MSAARSKSRSPHHRTGPVVRRGTLRLPMDVVRKICAGHPWVYREALDRRSELGEPGEPVELVDDTGSFIARGFVDGDSAISVRVLTRRKKQQVDAVMFAERVRSAIALRKQLLDWDAVEAMRLVNGEADGIPGVTVDRYGNYLVVQLFTPAVEAFTRWIYDALEGALAPEAIYEQQRYRSLGGDGSKAGAELVRGRPAPVELVVRENDLKFAVDVTSPLSAGLFADLRDGRQAVAEWAKDRRVLNLFSYTGSISVYAKHGGAKEVVSVDVSAKSHARSRKNFELSGFDPETPECIAGDAFKSLARFEDRGRKFDMVVIDPPAFASGTKGGKPWTAVRDYGELVAACLRVLEPGGVLIAASSTHRLSLADFEFALADGADLAQTRLRIVDRRSLPADFPTSPGFPEGNYLKFAVCLRD